MNIQEIIKSTGATVFRDRGGKQFAASDLTKMFSEGDKELRKLECSTAEVGGKTLVCRVDSLGRMRHDRWLFEIVSKSESKPIEETKDEPMKTQAVTKAKKVLKTVQETLEKKNNRNGTHPCMCGCGDNCEKFFRQGHDAKLKSQVLAYSRDSGPKPAALAQKAVQDYLAVAPWMTSELKKAVLN